MIGFALIAAAVAVAVLTAFALRLGSIVSTALAAYLVLVANLGLVTWGLSAFRAVDRIGLGAAQAVLLTVAALVWWRRGRPRPTLPVLVSEPVTLVVVAATGALLAYELVLALSAPADNWDSLTYHLSRVVAWAQHGGVYRIPNAPTPRMNEYQPLAEQQILFLTVAVGTAALYALPQFVAQLAILVAIYGSARRLGFEARAAVASAGMFAMFSLVALQSSQAENDVFAASFPAAAACLLLGGGRTEAVLAGVAAGLGLGAKLTTAIVLPILLALALLRGRRVALYGILGTVASFAAVGVAGYALNLANTGHVLGYLGTHIDTPSWEQPLHPSKLATGIDALYGTFDLSALTDRQIHLLWILGIVAPVVCGLWMWRRRGLTTGIAVGVLVAVPFVSPLLMNEGGNVLAWFARERAFPVRGPGGNVGGLNHGVQGSTFGPVGAVLFLGVPVATLAAWRFSRRIDLRHVTLALAVPVFYVGLAQETYNFYMTRFLLVPAALVAPLAALLFRHRAVTLAFLGVSSLVIFLVVTEDPLRPLDGRYGSGPPWTLTQVQAAYLTDETGVGSAVRQLGEKVPEHACIGAVLGGDEPAFFLAGPRLTHRVVYLPVDSALADAYRHLLSYVVVSTGPNRWAATTFRTGGWTVSSLGGYWLLATAPHAGDGAC